MTSQHFKKLICTHFIPLTCALSVLLSILYAVKGIQEVFYTGTWIAIAMNLLYVPFVLVFKKKGFAYFYLVYSIVLIFVLAFDRTYLFNNFTALFIMCIVVLINPKLELAAYILYFCACTIAFILNEESIVHFLIHILRSLWFAFLISAALNFRFRQKELILFDDEKEILNQLCNGKVYQKEVEGFSENTIYRKLKAARERNGNITREQLIELYRKELNSTNSQIMSS